MVALAMLQGSDGTSGTMLIFLVVLTLVTFVVLGVRFFVNLFEVITAPGASLKHHGSSDTAFYSFAVVFLGHLIGSIILVLNRTQMQAGYSEFSRGFGEFLALKNSNKNYQDVAQQWATAQLDSVYQSWIDSNLLWIGLVCVGIWLVAGLIYFLAAKMFGSPVSLSDLLGTTAYPMFFYTIGFCCYVAATFTSFSAFSEGFKPDGLAGQAVLSIVAMVLMLWAVVLYCIAFMQATDLGFGQLIVGFLLYVLIVGGASYLVGYKVTGPALQQFSSDVASIDFSKDNYHLPGTSSR